MSPGTHSIISCWNISPDSCNIICFNRKSCRNSCRDFLKSSSISSYIYFNRFFFRISSKDTPRNFSSFTHFSEIFSRYFYRNLLWEAYPDVFFSDKSFKNASTHSSRNNVDKLFGIFQEVVSKIFYKKYSNIFSFFFLGIPPRTSQGAAHGSSEIPPKIPSGNSLEYLQILNSFKITISNLTRSST